MIKKSILTLGLAIGLSLSTPVLAKTSFSGEYRQGEILSFGTSLTKNEEAELREYFGVPADMEAIYVDNATAIDQLGLAPDALDDYTGGWYSSAYVKLTDQGGVQVSSKNVSLVTNEMFANALITSGILNCEVNVSAPFMVTGESALAGILAGAEEIMGESLSEENKVIAKEEIDTTLEVADEILNDESNNIDSKSDSSTVASGIMNDIKEQVIKDSPNSVQIGQIITNVTNNYGVELSDETKARVASLMEDVNDLDIDYSEIKDTMKNIGNSIADSLKEAGVHLKESGLLESIGNWFLDLFASFGEWIKQLFVSIPDSNHADIENEELESTVAPTVEEEQDSLPTNIDSSSLDESLPESTQDTEESVELPEAKDTEQTQVDGVLQADELNPNDETQEALN